MDASGLIKLVWAANRLSGRVGVSPELMDANVRSAAMRVGGALTRRFISALMDDGGQSFDLPGLSGLVRSLDALIVEGDGLSKPLTDADIALVWDLRTKITQCMTAYPDGGATAAAIDLAPATQAARSLAEAAAIRIGGLPYSSDLAPLGVASTATTMDEAAVPRVAAPPPADAAPGAAEKQAPLAEKAVPASFGVFSRALMHLHDAIEGKVSPEPAENEASRTPHKAPAPQSSGKSRPNR